MKDANGQPITDTVRNAQFESTEDDNTFADQKSFANDIDVPSITGYTAYAGLKDGDQLKIVDGKAQTTGAQLPSMGRSLHSASHTRTLLSTWCTSAIRRDTVSTIVTPLTTRRT